MASEEELFTLYRDLAQEARDNHRRLSEQLKKAEDQIGNQIAALKDCVDNKISTIEKTVNDHDRHFKNVKVGSMWLAGTVTVSGIASWFLSLFDAFKPHN